MKLELLVSGITIGIGLVLLALTMHMRLEADYTLETAKSIVFRPRVVVYRYDVPIVIQAPQVKGVFEIPESRVTPVFSRDSQVWAGH